MVAITHLIDRATFYVKSRFKVHNTKMITEAHLLKLRELIQACARVHDYRVVGVCFIIIQFSAENIENKLNIALFNNLLFF